VSRSVAPGQDLLGGGHVRLSSKPCGVSGCTEHKVKGKHHRYCFYHEQAEFQSNPNSRKQAMLSGQS
jgi:hypothetical protein